MPYGQHFARTNTHLISKTVPYLRSWPKLNYAVMLPLYCWSRPGQNKIISGQRKRAKRSLCTLGQSEGIKWWHHFHRSYQSIWVFMVKTCNQVCQEILQFEKKDNTHRKENNVCSCSCSCRKNIYYKQNNLKKENMWFFDERSQV